MNIPRPIDAELVTLLHEITDDPSQLLAGFTKRLRDTKHELPTALALDEDNFFNQSERRMLRRHREEIGYLLNERCIKFLHDLPSAKNGIEWKGKRIEQNAMERRQKSLLIHGTEVDDEVRSALFDSITAENLVHVSELVFRLRPSFWTKVDLALALKEDGQLDKAFSLLTSSSADRLSANEQSVVSGNKSFVLCAQKSLNLALQHARDAHRLDNSRAVSVASWAAMELCCGSMQGILESSSALEHCIEFDNEALDKLVLNLQEKNSEYRPCMQDSQFGIIRSLMERLPSRARKLANAIIETN